VFGTRNPGQTSKFTTSHHHSLPLKVTHPELIMGMTKKQQQQHFDLQVQSKACETTNGWINPFGQDDNDEDNHETYRPTDGGERRKSTTKKKKRSSSHRKRRSHRHHHMTPEEYSELSSKAESLLDDLLGDDNEFDDAYSRKKNSNPFEEDDVDDVVDKVEEDMMNGEEINKEKFSQLMRGVNPSASLLDDEEEEDVAEDSSSNVVAPHTPSSSPSSSSSPRHRPPENNTRRNHRNPFEEDASTAPKPNQPIMNGGDLNKNFNSQHELTRKSTDTTGDSYSSSPVREHEKKSDNQVDDEDFEDDDVPELEDERVESEEEEEDVVESSKRLLKMADQRLQYQQYNDEIKRLREHVDRMKHQAEAMSEQLRRAVETKCDLVLAQTELERCHEQNLISKDDEIRDIKRYVQELVDYQASNDLTYMNEIAILSNRVDKMTAKHKKEMDAKDAMIADLQAKAASSSSATTSTTTLSPSSSSSSSVSSESSLVGIMSIELFRSRFLSSPEGSSNAPIVCT